MKYRKNNILYVYIILNNFINVKGRRNLLITYYTDGSCKGNPGPGGYGCVGLNENNEVVMCAASSSYSTTNNREELKSILHILEKFGSPDKPVPTVYSDSSYAVNTYNNWMFSWARNNWIKSDKKVPENLDIIKEYYELIQKGYNINLNHIRGHKGILGNEIADKLASGQMTVDEIVKKYGSADYRMKYFENSILSLYPLDI